MATSKKNGQGKSLRAVLPVAPVPECHKVSEEALAELAALNQEQAKAEQELVSLTMQRFQVEQAQAQAANKLAQAAESYRARVLAVAKAKGLDVETKGWKFELTTGTFTGG